MELVVLNKFESQYFMLIFSARIEIIFYNFFEEFIMSIINYNKKIIINN